MTILHLKSSMYLEHVAGRPCLDESRPEVGSSDTERTYSEWWLRDAQGGRLTKAPSFLSDPKYSLELSDYHKKNDSTTVMESKTGNTIVIVEDRSPTFPRASYILFRKNGDKTWTQSEVLFDSFLPESATMQGDSSFSGGLDRVYPDILEVTDTHLRYSQRGGEKLSLISELPKRENKSCYTTSYPREVL